MPDGERSAGYAVGKNTYRTFQDPDVTATGAQRASIAIDRLQTLWVNTGTLCNIECRQCYIESSPKNDRLSYITAEEVEPFFSEATRFGATEIGFTGGEPFMNPDFLNMLDLALSRGFKVLVLTNAMQPMMRPKIKQCLLELNERFPGRLTLRVSLDHYNAQRHDEERGAGSFKIALSGLSWLDDNGFLLSVASRTLWQEGETQIRHGFARLFERQGVGLNALDLADVILFPEMNETAPVPEITDACWGILGKDPKDVMCSSSRMVVKRKGARAPIVLSCTLLAYDQAFELGATLEQAMRPIKLNHPHCAKFCVLGGASCSA